VGAARPAFQVDPLGSLILKYGVYECVCTADFRQNLTRRPEIEGLFSYGIHLIVQNICYMAHTFFEDDVEYLLRQLLPQITTTIHLVHDDCEPEESDDVATIIKKVKTQLIENICG